VKEIAVLEDIQEDYTPYVHPQKHARPKSTEERQLIELSLTSKPIYGFIFLYQYVDDDFSTGHEEETNRVWFINQVRMFDHSPRFSGDAEIASAIIGDA